MTCKNTFGHTITTIKSRLSESRLSEATGLFEDDRQSRLFSLLSIAIKLLIIRISIIRKFQFFKVICWSQLKKLLLNYPSRFEVQMSRMVIMFSLLYRVRFLHPSDLANELQQVIDSFHIVSAHAPNCLVPCYLREITREGAIFIQLPIHYPVEYGKDEKKNKFANKD